MLLATELVPAFACRTHVQQLLCKQLVGAAVSACASAKAAQFVGTVAVLSVGQQLIQTTHLLSHAAGS